jgi:hypothetical protein
MLYSIQKGKFVTVLPHEKEFKVWKSKLNTNDYNVIINELNNRVDGDEIHTAGWIPGSNWMGTVFEPLFHACGKNEESAAKFFGIIVFKVIMDRSDCWGFGKYEKNGVPIRSMTYFKLNNVP